jgi:hypothetical protein
MLALDGRAVSARSAMTEWVTARNLRKSAATHSVRALTRAATSPIKGEDATACPSQKHHVRINSRRALRARRPVRWIGVAHHFGDVRARNTLPANRANNVMFELIWRLWRALGALNALAFGCVEHG